MNWKGLPIMRSRLQPRRLGRVASLSSLCGLSLAQAAFGAVTARISGIVKDPTDAVVPAAQVTAVETQTGIKQTTRTDTQGFYSFPSLPLAITISRCAPTASRNTSRRA